MLLEAAQRNTMVLSEWINSNQDHINADSARYHLVNSILRKNTEIDESVVLYIEDISDAKMKEVLKKRLSENYDLESE